MIHTAVPKLPMRDKQITREFYLNQLGFTDIGSADYPGYLLLKRDQAEIHFFEHPELDPLTNDGQVYLRCKDINQLFDSLKAKSPSFDPLSAPVLKPWGQMEFALLDPDHNLLTFGEALPQSNPLD